MFSQREILPTVPTGIKTADEDPGNTLIEDNEKTSFTVKGSDNNQKEEISVSIFAAASLPTVSVPGVVIDKDDIGRLIIKLSILFVLISSSLPVSLLIYNVSNGQWPSIWWLQATRNMSPWQRKPKPRIVEDGEWPQWVERLKFHNKKFESLVDLAFCEDQVNAKAKPLFPLGEFHPWKNVFEPWLMDAVVSDTGHMVNILVADANSCNFDVTTWQDIVSYSRRYGSPHDVHGLANGSLDSINVKYADRGDMSALFSSDQFVGKRVMCRYYDRKSQLLTSIPSHAIIPGMIIRCPIPSLVRSRMNTERLHMRLQIPFPSSYSPKRQDTAIRNNLRSILTNNSNAIKSFDKKSNSEQSYVLSPLFGVCPQSNHFIAPIDIDHTSENHPATNERLRSTHSMTYTYNVSVCMSTVSRSKMRLVEWIEYHRMIGVDHFFIYDRYIKSLRSENAISYLLSTTATGSTNEGSQDRVVDDDDDDGSDDNYYYDNDVVEGNSLGRVVRSNVSNVSNVIAGKSFKHKESLFEILRDYIDYGIVTVVPWPYKDCVDHLACDRAIQVKDISTNTKSSNGHDKISSSSSVVFQPPPKLQKLISSQSCYLRFQSSSKWMALLDDKDFIAFDLTESLKMLSNQSEVSLSQRPLETLIRHIDESHNNLAAIELLPSAVVSCPSKIQTFNNTLDVSFDEEDVSKTPRYGTWQHMTSVPSSMKKIIVKTSLVTSLTLSHVLLVEFQGDRPIIATTSHSASQSDISSLIESKLIHKQSHGRSRSIRKNHRRLISSSFDISVNDNMESFSPRLNRYEGRRGDHNAREGEYSLAQLDPSIMRILEYRSIGDRMNLCEKSLFSFKTLSEICENIEHQNPSVNSHSDSNTISDETYQTHRFVNHNVEQLQRRYSHGMTGDIPE